MSAASILDLARAKGIRITTAESCTGGMIAAALTDIAGSSDVFERGFVTYSNAAKTEMLAVPATLIETYGAVSEEVARAMAQGALSYADAHIAVSVTGIAGPGGSEHKPEGRVCFGLATQGQQTLVETIEYGPLGRAGVRGASVDHALQLIERTLHSFA